ATIQNYQFEVAGSGDSKALVNMIQGLIRREYKPDDIKTFIDTVGNPHLGAFVAYTALSSAPQLIDIQKAAAEKLATAYPDSEASAAYMNYVATQQRSLGPVSVGATAPDIKMPNPDGKEYALSDLQGKVVLLDFWASWCGPCRRENPAVVDVCNRYKDQGFTVFSVSLDGLDTRSKARFSNQDDINRAMEGQKQRWVNAIAQDKLAWPYHVSDLQKWESAASRLYGVTSIPRTFLIGRDGKVAAMNLRGARQIEEALKQAL
ncbi:MAG: TlpA disulfide reductase family protein, partial [Bacteroidota bacterium]